MEELVQRLRQRYLQLMEHVVAHLELQVSYQEFEERLRQELDGFARDVLEAVVEAVDERLREEKEARPGWVVARRGDEKQVLSPFGMLSYRRTYFRHRASKRYAYLADAAIGVTPHQRVEDGVKAQLVEVAVEQSYRKSGQWRPEKAWHVSAQTVMQALRETKIPPGGPSMPAAKRRVRYLYIEADEDHVPNQRGAHWQPRLVYVHEGRRRRGRRRMELIRPHYFGGLYEGNTQRLWEAVWRYLDGHYELEDVEAIFVSGDGASWIRRGCEYIPKSVFVLDRYHVQQLLTDALGAGSPYRDAVWKALTSSNAGEVRRLLQQAYQEAGSERRREAIKRAEGYLRRNWDGIRAWKRYEGIWCGCSAEGHVSHIYSARMSTRPMAWGRDGVKKMAGLRVLQANGGSARAAYLQRKSHRPLQVSSKWLQRVKADLVPGTLLPGETLGNLPALRGARSSLTRALRGLAQLPAV